MHRPRIGIPLCLDDRGRWRAGRDYLYIDHRYATAVEGAGGIPIHLPIQREVDALVDSCDGLLIPGGDDFPSEHVLPDGVRLDLVASDQLAFDTRLFETARSRGLPIFGICYGMQLMVHARGGRLDGHLPSQRPEANEHRLPSDGRHPIEIVTGSLLAEILGTGAASVNSLHHQAVRESGPAYRAAAHSDDGVIEAIERAPDAATDEGGARGASWEIGVQWHPEKMDEESSGKLFGAFVEASRRHREARQDQAGRERRNA